MPAEQYLCFNLNNSRRCSVVLYRVIHFIVLGNELKRTNCSFVLLSLMLQSMFVV